MPSFLTPLVREPQSGYALRNSRSGECLADTVEPAFDSATRNRGLLGRDSLPQGSALILAPCTSVHTWFMRFPIDVVFVTRSGEITKVCPAVGPWRFAVAWNSHAVVELPAGGAGDSRSGDTLELVANRSQG
jgi:hypothetical protein